MKTFTKFGSVAAILLATSMTAQAQSDNYVVSADDAAVPSIQISVEGDDGDNFNDSADQKPSVRRSAARTGARAPRANTDLHRDVLAATGLPLSGQVSPGQPGLNVQVTSVEVFVWTDAKGVRHYADDPKLLPKTAKKSVVTTVRQGPAVAAATATPAAASPSVTDSSAAVAPSEPAQDK